MSEVRQATGGATADSGPVGRLREDVLQAAASVRGTAGEIPTPTLERPPRAEFGDYSSNMAMLLAPALEVSPRELAECLGGELRDRLGGRVERVEVAGPGFLNLFLSDSWFCASVGAMREAADAFGAGAVPTGKRERVLVEFVSANPTGPLTAAGGRHAAWGDSLARVLEFGGHDVTREYYVNDHGTQVDLFGRSIAVCMTGTEPPEGGYRGEYVTELAERVAAEGIDSADIEAITGRGIELVLEGVRATLERFRVRFDGWFSERELHQQGRVGKALEALSAGEHVYSSEGALWLRSSRFGDDKDRVLRRSSGEPTYLAADIAYHEDKRARGFDRLIDVWGADHHGHVSRMKAAFEALGADPEQLEPVIMQLVHVVERGERAQMSKRKGEFVTLDELIDDIGVDAGRFFMLQRSADTALDLDLDLARRQSEENPVYYVQYAHARIASILRKVGEERLEAAEAADPVAVSAALEPAERALIKQLLELPEQVEEAARRRAPHRLTTYALQIASDFHAFYRDCRVIGVEPRELEDFRLCVCVAARRVIARTLDLLGVEAPEQM